MTQAIPGRTGAVLELRGLSKTFGEVRALRDVDLTVMPGEVHALLGENGSGKSTLIKVLSGAYVPDRGARLWVQGGEVDLPLQPGRFRDLGLSFVHQDLGLLPELTVTENLRVSQTVAAPRGLIGWAREHRLAGELLQSFGLDIDPRARLGSLDQTERTLVAVLRAVSELGDRRSLLVLDEPTVFLPGEGVELLFRVVHELVADARMGVLLVSHDLAEVLDHADTVTVLRAGRGEGTRPTAGLTPAALAELIVGRRVEAGSRARAPRDDRAPALAVQGLRTRLLGGVDLTIAEGEVVGVTGLAGSGYEEFPAALYGALPATGSVSLAGDSWELTRSGPRASLRRGMAYVPADRRTEGAALTLSVAENVTLPVLTQLRRGPGVSARAVRARADSLIAEYDVRPARADVPMANLSGGNAQKAVLGKWLQDSPSLLLLHEPTQGIDVGAKDRIFRSIVAAADQGLSVLVASSDYDQLCQLCDRVVVLAGGRAIAELSGAELTYERLSALVLTSLSRRPTGRPMREAS